MDGPRRALRLGVCGLPQRSCENLLQEAFRGEQGRQRRFGFCRVRSVHARRQVVRDVAGGVFGFDKRAFKVFDDLPGIHELLPTRRILRRCQRDKKEARMRACTLVTVNSGYAHGGCRRLSARTAQDAGEKGADLRAGDRRTAEAAPSQGKGSVTRPRRPAEEPSVSHVARRAAARRGVWDEVCRRKSARMTARRTPAQAAARRAKATVTLSRRFAEEPCGSQISEKLGANVVRERVAREAGGDGGREVRIGLA